MKTILLLFFCIFFLNASSQNSWHVLSPLPTGIYLYGVSMISENEFWVVGTGGKILHTDDAGISWQSSEPLGIYPLGIKMFNQNDGWLTSSGDSIYKTSDGGLSWIPVYAPGHEYGNGYFKNMNEAWLHGNTDTLLHTIDGGSTWMVDTLTGSANSTILFTDSMHGWTFASSKLWRSADGGNTWNKITDLSLLGIYDVRSISFVDSLTGYLSVFNWTSSVSSAYKTTDGGFTWTQITAYPTQFYGGGVITFFSILNGIALDTEFPIYYLTHDGGITWTMYSLNEAGPVSHLDFFNNTFVAAGPEGAMILSNDLGLNSLDLIDRVVPSRMLYSVSFPDTSTGYFHSVHDGLYKTTNAGQSWIKIDSSNNSFGNKIFFLNPQAGWMQSGGQYTIKITTDGGMTWANSLPPQYSIYDFCFVTPTRGWAVEWSGKIISTTDGGYTWNTDTAGIVGDQFSSIHFSDSLHGWAINGPDLYSIKVWRTVDGGNTWEQKYQRSLSNFAATGCMIFTTDSSHAFIGAAGNFLICTSDGGNTWTDKTIINSPSYLQTWTIYFSDTLTGYCGGSFRGTDILLKTSDGGNTWTTLLQNNGLQVRDISYVDSSHIWAVGVPSLLIAYRPETALPVEDFSLRENVCSIYPNPCTSYVMLRTGNTLREHPATIRLMNVLMQQVFETTAYSGDKDLEIDTQCLPPGPYILIVEIGERVHAMKVMKSE